MKRVDPYGVAAATEQAVAARRRRLGTGLHQIAVDLAQERRRTAQLQRELTQLRAPTDHTREDTP